MLHSTCDGRQAFPLIGGMFSGRGQFRAIDNQHTDWFSGGLGHDTALDSLRASRDPSWRTVIRICFHEMEAHETGATEGA